MADTGLAASPAPDWFKAPVETSGTPSSSATPDNSASSDTAAAAPDWFKAPSTPSVTPSRAAGSPSNGSTGEDWSALLKTGYDRIAPDAIGLPNTLLGLAKSALTTDPNNPITNAMGSAAGWLQGHTYSPQELLDMEYKRQNYLKNSPDFEGSGLSAGDVAAVSPDADQRARAYNAATPDTPYVPRTLPGKIVQDVEAGAPMAAVGGGGLLGLATREAANLGGTTASDVVGDLYPNHPIAQLVTGLLGSAAGGGAVSLPQAAGGILTAAKNAAAQNLGIGAESAASRQVANQLATTAGQDGADIVSNIKTNYPTANESEFGNMQSGSSTPLSDTWTFPGQSIQPAPTLGDVTGNLGLRNLTYNDRVAAQKAGDTTYWENAQQTNAAQRQAIADATPDNTGRIATFTDMRDAGTQSLPSPLTAQEAGQEVRGTLQAEKDRLTSERADNVQDQYDALGQSGTKVNLQPVIDQFTPVAASSAGEVGQATKRALDQFKSGTGITLDTPAFADSVLSALGDLAGSYPRGSASSRAVMQVKNALEDHLQQTAPEVLAPRQAYAGGSTDLDRFAEKPFPAVLKTDRYGNSYNMYNEQVAKSFLEGPGSSDALDRVQAMFPDRQGVNEALERYISGQVQARAVNADGSIDSAALAQVLQPYQRALMRFPDLKMKFAYTGNAQNALDSLAAQQQLLDKFGKGLGTQELDAKGNAVYSPTKFGNAYQEASQPGSGTPLGQAMVGGKLQPSVAASGPSLLEVAYGKDGAAVVKKVNDQLNSMEQTAQAKAPGTSGTSQTSVASNVLGHWPSIVGSGLGLLLGHAGGEHLGGTVIGGVAGKWVEGNRANFAGQIENIRRQALTDPAFARSLLTNYNPKLPSAAGKQAMSYVQRQLPNVTGFAAPISSTIQPQ